MGKPLVIVRLSLLTGSALLFAFLSVCYWGRYDFCTAATVYPPWCWTIVGVLVAFVGSSPRIRAVSLALAGVWLGFLLTFADTPLSLLRAWLPEPQSAARLRIISLNCAGAIDAAREVAALDPHIVLFQESPRRAELVALAEELYGLGNHVCWGVDASIIARGEVSTVDVPASLRGNLVHARVELDGSTLDVVSLRLIPSAFRMDLWSGRCWEAFRTNREQRHRQLGEIVNYLQTIPVDAPLVVGGDFNAPPGDAVFQLIRPRLTDSFAAAGRGWGATITSEWPLIRIDQIYCSTHWEEIAVFAQKTRFSDHRMVVGDFSVEPEVTPVEAD